MYSDLSELLLHQYENADTSVQPVVPPAYISSNFSFTTVHDFRAALTDEFNHTLYSRGHNPNVSMLAAKLAAMEGTEECLLFSSGAAAVSVVITALLKSGDHVVCIQNPYAWSARIFTNILSRYGVSVTFSDASDSDALIKACKDNTRLIFLESPNSITFEVQDLRKIADFARKNHILTMIDNSYASPVFQNPHALGIDLVMHSASKYINGHSDIIAGVVCGSRKILEPVFRSEYLNYGAILHPHSAWLILRGLRTLEIRMKKSYETAIELVNFCKSRPEFEEVLWPFLPECKGYEIAKSQMSGCGALFSVVMAEKSRNKIERFCNALKLFKMAVSWGGYECLQFPVLASVPESVYNPENKRHRIVRLYAGLESPEILKNDIRNALNSLK